MLKFGTVTDLIGMLGYLVNGRTTESLVEPHNLTRLNRITQIDNPVSRLTFLLENQD